MRARESFMRAREQGDTQELLLEFSYRMCSLIERVLWEGNRAIEAKHYSLNSRTEWVLLQNNMFSYRMCCSIECVLL